MLTCPLRFPSIGNKINDHSGGRLESVPRCWDLSCAESTSCCVPFHNKGRVISGGHRDLERKEGCGLNHKGHGIGNAALVFGSWKMTLTMFDLQTQPVIRF